MRWILFLTVISCASYIQAQQPEEEWEPALLEEEQWPSPVNGSPYRLEATIRIVRLKQKIAKTHYETQAARAVWLKNESWLADSLYERYAAYSQLLFDCYEYEARRISGQINAEGNDSLLLLQGALERAEKLKASLTDYTVEGTDLRRMREMRVWMDSLLSVTPRYDTPGSEAVNSGFFMDAGAGVRFCGGGLADYFGTVAGFSYGVKLRIRRIGIDFNRLIGTTRVLQTKTFEDFKFEQGDWVSLRQNAFSLGYETFRSGRFSCVPFAGVSTFRVNNLEQPDGSLYNRGPVSVNPSAGISVSYFTQPFYQDSHLQYCWYFVLRSQFDAVEYLKELKGNTIRFQLGVGMAFNRIRTFAQD